MKKTSNISIFNITFIICVLVINISAITVLLITSFGTAVGVTTGTAYMTLSDVMDMYIQTIVIMAALLFMNSVFIYVYYRTKNGLPNPFRKKKTIGELMKKEGR